MRPVIPPLSSVLAVGKNRSNPAVACGMKEYLSPKQLGHALGVSEASVKRWCDKGRIHAVRTEGGHRRLPIASVLRYLRETQAALVRPEILGLPPSTGQGERQLAKVKRHMRQALEEGDGERFRRLAFNLYLGGQSCADICDLFTAGVFHELGELWEHGSVEIYQERRACEICLRLLHELRSALPAIPENAPYALGATLKGDSYTLASTMAELVLREGEWRAETLGTDLPAPTICRAIEEEKPQLFWLSVSHIASETAFLEQYESIYEAVQQVGAAVAVGGRALSEGLRRQMVYTTFCDQMRHLVALADTLKSKRTSAEEGTGGPGQENPGGERP